MAGIANREQTGRESAEELAVERDLLATKATAIAAAIELALRQVQPRHVVAARSLEDRAQAEMASIAEALRPVKSPRAPRPDPRAQLRRALLAAQTVRVRTKRAVVIPTAALVVAAAGMAAVLALRPAGEPPTAIAPTASPTREGQVAGGTPETMSFTFDESTAYGTPGPGWELRGESGIAEIVPFPDPFDRSLHVSSGSGTGTAVICRTGLPDTDLVSVDLSANDWRGMSLEVRQGTEVVTIFVDHGNRLVLQADAMTNEVTERFEGTGWQRLTLSLDLVDGVIGFHVEPRGGDAGLSSGMSLPSAWTATTGQTTEVCISPPGDRVDGLYLDNLIISAGARESG